MENEIKHMADHAGGRRSVGNPGTKLWRTPVEVTQYWRPKCSLSARYRFLKPNKNKFISMKPNNNLNHFQQLLFHTIPPPLDQYNHFGLTKNGRQNRSSGAKTGLLRFRFKMLVSNDSMYFYNSFLSFQIKDF